MQGNLDPKLLASGGKIMNEKAKKILESVGGRKGYIFNLGHGVLPETSVDNVKKLVEFVHSYPI